MQYKNEFNTSYIVDKAIEDQMDIYIKFGLSFQKFFIVSSTVLFGYEAILKLELIRRSSLGNNSLMDE